LPESPASITSIRREETSDTKTRVKEFINELADQLLAKLREGSVLSLSEIYLYALSIANPVKNVSPRIYGVFLLGQLRRLRDVLLDRAAEAISAHVDKIENDFLYAELSASIMRYAIHELNVLQTLIALLEKSLKEEEQIDTELLEEFAFTALARFMATATLLSRISTEELGKILVNVTKMLDFFISEELSIISEKLMNKA